MKYLKKISKEDVINYVLLDSYCLTSYRKISIFLISKLLRRQIKEKDITKKLLKRTESIFLLVSAVVCCVAHNV